MEISFVFMISFQNTFFQKDITKMLGPFLGYTVEINVLRPEEAKLHLNCHA